MASAVSLNSACPLSHWSQLSGLPSPFQHHNTRRQGLVQGRSDRATTVPDSIINTGALIDPA